jgi:hypothetical protein
MFLSLAGATAAALLAGAAMPVAAAAHTGPPAKYYLSLGDSLAQGVQPATPPRPPGVMPGQSIETGQGYVDDLFAHYSAQFPGNLHLVKLGCPGETTTSMLTGAGSPCTYPQGSQLAAAVAFIRAHRSAVVLLTIDIGANNIDGCAGGGMIDPARVARSLAAVGRDLPAILGALWAAVGEDTVIAGINLYDPCLAAYLTDRAGGPWRRKASRSPSLSTRCSAPASGPLGIAVADVQTACSMTDFTDTAAPPGVGIVPVNVARTCE